MGEGAKVITEKELKAHKTWMAIEGCVYELDDFLDSHPGGPEILEEYLGGDGTEGFRETHSHSKAAEELLPSMQIGVLAGSKQEGRAIASSEAQDKAQRIIDPNQPYTFQVGKLGEHYQEWVHTPIHVKEPIVLLGSWMEPFTKVHWWVPLVFWIPAIVMMLRYSVSQWPLSKVLPLYFGMAAAGWPFLEYFLHRVLYHMDTSSYWPNTAHFLFHGVHHLTPMDKTRLVAPPVLAIFISTPLLFFFYLISPSLPFLWTLTAGLFSGYLVYDEIHYWIHHGTLPFEWLRRLKAHHMAHHYAHPNENFGVSNTWTDILFGSLVPLENSTKAK